MSHFSPFSFYIILFLLFYVYSELLIANFQNVAE